MPDTPDIARPSLLRRLTAIIYDSLLVIALVAVVNALALGVVVWLSDGEREVLPPLAVQALTILSVYGFFVMFWLKQGQTLGMQAWRIKLLGFDGGPPRPGPAILRCLGASLSAACLGAGYLWCLVDRNGRCWHDYISRTDLLLLPRDSRDENGTAAGE